jgi:hypothetical protein
MWRRKIFLPIDSRTTFFLSFLRGAAGKESSESGECVREKKLRRVGGGATAAQTA